MKILPALKMIIKEIKLGNKVTLIQTEIGFYRVEYTYNVKNILTLFSDWKAIKNY